MKTFLAALVWFLAGTAGVMAQPGTGQNKFCDMAFPFCTGTLYNFPAGVNAGAGEPGPCYSCLTTRPNPAWYYMLVDDPGSIIITMHSEPSKDIDFCCWGPFPSQDCCDDLTCNKVVDCSYSPAPIETVNINNAQTGQYYMLVITNYSNQPCNIIFEQTGGTGTTDCSILPPAATSNSPICIDQTLLLSAQNVANATYSWTGPNGFTSNQQNPTIPNAQPENSGTYYLTIEVNGQTSIDSSTTEVFVYDPIASAGNDTSIANGTFATLHGSCTGGCGSYTYHWEPAGLLTDPDVKDPQTVNLFATTIFTVTATDDSASCQVSEPVTVNVTGGVLAVNAIAEPSSICFGEVSQLSAFGSGGAGTYTYEWTGPNGFSSTLQNPSVQPTVTTTYTVEVNDGFNTATNTVTVTVKPLPVANAGANDTIPHGTYTFLSGTVPGGTNYYMYSWQPANLLVNPNVQFPQTANLTSTTVYTLTVTDMVTNCVSANNATVSVVVTGGPLNVNPSASPAWVCIGDSARLFASAGGGDTLGYQYTWTSDPPGFTSSEANPWTRPLVNTTYSVSVNDGFNTVNGSTPVYLYPQPQIHLGPPDTTLCVFDTLVLNAGNPGGVYLWSNGSTEQTITASASGMGFEVQDYTVRVTSPDGCQSESSISVIFRFDACVGIGEPGGDHLFMIYPNPTSEKFFVSLEGARSETRIQVTDLFGRTVFSTALAKPDQQHLTREIILPDIPRGIYLVRFSNDEFSGISKLVIQ